MRKDFHRENPLFSLCGLNCGLCQLHIGGYCPGCGGGAGNQSCAIARCGMAHGVAYCWDCADYPCERYEGLDAFDSFAICRTRARDIERAQSIGTEAYMAELRERMAILDGLLGQYNDGRHKRFFVAAVSLLPVDALRRAVEALSAAPDIPEDTQKARAARARSLLEAAAECRGIDLRFHIKPAKRKGKREG